MDTFPLMKESAYHAESQDPHKPASGKIGAVQSAPAVSDTGHRIAAGKVHLAGRNAARIMRLCPVRPLR